MVGLHGILSRWSTSLVIVGLVIPFQVSNSTVQFESGEEDKEKNIDWGMKSGIVGCSIEIEK